MLHPPFLLGLITGGAVIYWFTGASMQAVSTGAYRAVEFIKANIKLDGAEKASIEDSKKVVEICTQYAQKGMFNIFLAVFFSTLAFACLEPFFFIGYLISIALFGLYQAIFMANAGGAWDNAKKVVEVELKEKGTPLHAACVVGDTVGDPFKDTSSVAMNPVIKFTTLFGLLAVELAVQLRDAGYDSTTRVLAGVFFAHLDGLRLPLVLRHAHQERRRSRRLHRAGRQDRCPRRQVARERSPAPPATASPFFTPPDFLKQKERGRHSSLRCRACSFLPSSAWRQHPRSRSASATIGKNGCTLAAPRAPRRSTAASTMPRGAASRPTTASRRTSPTRARRRRSAPSCGSLYDDHALYIGVRCWDSDPAGIVERLTRRDRDTDADKVTVDISSKNDRITAYHFDVNVSGVLADGVRFNDTDYSGDWDGLWLGATHRDARGWSAEIEIPLQDAALRGRRAASSASRCAAASSDGRRSTSGRTSRATRAARCPTTASLDGLDGLHAAAAVSDRPLPRRQASTSATTRIPRCSTARSSTAASAPTSRSA